MAGNIEFDAARYARLKVAYAEAVKAEQETFFFEGHTFLTAYAKYVIEYLKPKFENRP